MMTPNEFSHFKETYNEKIDVFKHISKNFKISKTSFSIFVILSSIHSENNNNNNNRLYFVKNSTLFT